MFQRGRKGSGCRVVVLVRVGIPLAHTTHRAGLFPGDRCALCFGVYLRCCLIRCCAIVVQMSQPSTDEAVGLLKAALLREVATDPAMLFPRHENLQAAINFSLLLTGHIGKLATEAACVFSSLCSSVAVCLLNFSCLVVVIAGIHRNLLRLPPRLPRYHQSFL